MWPIFSLQRLRRRRRRPLKSYRLRMMISASTSPPTLCPMVIFDRARVRQLRERAARHAAETSGLLEAMADSLCERMLDTTRSFPLALDLGCRTGQLTTKLLATGRVARVVCADVAPSMVHQAAASTLQAGCVLDIERLPFRPGMFDAIFSVLTLHTVNDVPGMLLQLRRLLKPDGLLCIGLLGPATLQELRESFLAAEVALDVPVRPHIAPGVDVKQAGALLQRAGFAPVITDAFTYHVMVPTLRSLCEDIRHLGENLALAAHPCTPLGLWIWPGVEAHYHTHHRDKETGYYRASVEMITCTGLPASGVEP